jgi:cytoskeletal protein RodZ
MDVTRIQVPLSLPEPDFEDETTVVSARQVVPLEQARVQDRRRNLFAILPLLVAATFCGALGAMVVTYFERPATAPAISQPAIVTAKDELRPSTTAPSPDTIATTNSSKTEEVTSASSQAAVALPTSASSSDSVENRAGAKPEQDTTSVKKPASSPDPRQLVRQRRVHPPTDPASQTDEPKPRGAARIQDIFSGPNH